MTAEPTSHPASHVATVLAALFGALGLYLLWVSLPWPLIHDAPIMHYVAKRIAAGAAPYRDLFDMNQPGVYLLHLAVVRTLGDGDLAWRLFDLGWLALTAALVGLFARRWGPTAAAGAAVLFSVYHLAGGAWQAGQRDFVLCAFLLAAALMVAWWIENGFASRETPDETQARSVARRVDDNFASREAPDETQARSVARRVDVSPWSLALAGLALGAGITLKPHAVLFALALGALALVAHWRLSRTPAALALYVLGLVVPPIAALGWVAARGGLRAWRAIVFEYLIPLYSRLTRHEDWRFWRSEVWIALGAAALLSLGATAWRHRLTWRHGIAAVGLAYGIVHFLGQRKGWEYHLYPLAAFAAVLAFSEVATLLGERRWVTGGLVAASLVASLGLLALRGGQTVNAAWIWDKEYVVRLLVHDLSGRMRPGDTIQVFDTTEGGIHALLRLGAREPTRFLYDFHFFHDVDHPTIQRLRAELVRDLTAHPPRFVVVFVRGWPTGSLDRFSRFPALARFLEERYTAVQRRAGYVILEARHRS